MAIPAERTYRHSMAKVAEIRAFPRNARTHSPAQVQQIAASIREFGFTNPILVDEDMALIAGHGRLEASLRLGLVELPAITVTGLSEAQKRALRLADNKLALNAGWDASDTNHGAQKPVECMRRPIENNSSPGQAVYDPFVGSGTTIIAAEMTGRACHAIEISPTYCDVAVLRWQAFTGQTATRPDGTLFPTPQSAEPAAVSVQ